LIDLTISAPEMGSSDTATTPSTVRSA
jgi:hypothetical protein